MDGLFIQQLFTDPAHFLTWTVLLVFSICVHEYAHAITAFRLGDDTAAMSGHLTLNPMKQMGALSLVMLALVGIAWGAVPVNISTLRRNARNGVAIVSAAGPAANLALSCIFLILFVVTSRLAGVSEQTQPVLHLFATGALMNLYLMFFNLIPIPPLDGFGIASSFIRELRNVNPVTLAQFSNIGLMIMLFSGIGNKALELALRAILGILPDQDKFNFAMMWLRQL